MMAAPTAYANCIPAARIRAGESSVTGSADCSEAPKEQALP